MAGIILLRDSSGIVNDIVLKQVSEERGRTWEIVSDSFWFRCRLDRLWEYRHLVVRLVRRDFLVSYQQTILGPLWILFQPLITLGAYLLVFNKGVGLSTDGIEPILFYLSGIILWSVFAEGFTGTACTFIQNRDLFAKVSFPLLTVPLAVIANSLLRFAVQFTFFCLLVGVLQPAVMLEQPLVWAVSTFVSVLLMAGFGLGLGLVFSIITARYRDLVNVIQLLVRLMMFATPVIYPMSSLNEDIRKWAFINPLSSPLECFRYGFSGHGTCTPGDLLYSLFVVCLFVAGGVILFNKYSARLQDVI